MSQTYSPNASDLANLAENRKTLIRAWVHFPMELSKNISHKQVLAHF